MQAFSSGILGTLSRLRVSPKAAPAPDRLSSGYAFIRHHVIIWRWHFVLLAVAVLVAAACAVVVQYAMKMLVDAMAGPSSQGGYVWNVLALFIGVMAVESALWRLSGCLACRATVGVGVDLRLDLFDRLNQQPMRYFAEQLAGSLAQRITATAGNFGALINTLVWRVAPQVTDFIGALVIFTFVEWRLALVVGILVLSFTAGLITFGERGRPLHRAYAGKAGTVSGELVDIISNMWAVKAFSARERERERLRERFMDEAGAQEASWMYTEKTRISYDVALLLMTAGVLSWAVYLWRAGSITPGDVVVVGTLTFRILHGSRDVALAIVDLGQQFGYVDETLRVIARQPSVLDRPDSPAITRGGGSVEFRNVTFAYGNGRLALDNVSFMVRPSEKVGIVGPSGAGKSTLVHLIQRLYDLQQGHILVDGQPIHLVAQDSLRDALAVVPQEISLFHRSVKDNVLFGEPGASNEEFYKAAASACCLDFISALPEAEHTVVGERGAKLSGGQRQRIGIARVLLKNAPIIVFDEATSALDTETEIAVHRNIVELYKERTVIAVAHRLSSLAGFDRILVVDGGRVVDEGTAVELRHRNPFFARMWHLQAEGLTLEAA